MDYDINMKRFLKIMLLSPMAFSISGCKKQETPKPDPTPVDVILISGQSNAVGCTHANCITRSIGHSKYQEYMAGYPGIQIAYECWDKPEPGRFYVQNQHKSEDFVKVMLGQGNTEATFGPEIGIAEVLHEEYEGKLFIIKCACGASNLKDDWAKRDSKMYINFMNYVKKQMKNLQDKNYIPTIKAMCWMQGEGDSYDGYYQEYYENTKGFVSNLREDLKELSGNKDFPFIDAGISNAPLWQYYKKVNEAKQQFADESENNYYIDTIEKGMHTDEEPFAEPDRAHYDTESEVLLGNLFAEAFKPFLAK